MKHIYLYATSLLLLAACSTNKFEDFADEMAAGKPVDVSINLTVDAETAGTSQYDQPYNGDTRAVNDPETAASTIIKDLWVIQFNGTGDDAKLIGTPTYFTDYASATNHTVKLIASTVDNTIVFLANTAEPTMAFVGETTLSEFKTRFRKIKKQGDLFGKYAIANAEATATFPNDADYYMMMNGTTTSTITNGVTITAMLKRNVARVDFNLTIGDAAGITVDSVRLNSAPAVSHYFNNYTDVPNIFPASGSFRTVNFAPANESTSGTTTTYTFYTSTNRRGIISNSNEAAKNLFAPKQSTYIVVHAKYNDGSNSVPITYSFYLGENLTNDFNLKPNHKYTYNITIADKGNVKQDHRIYDWGTLDYSLPTIERANCYILNPAPIDNYKRGFRIPVDRIDKFWGNEGYENVENYTIKESREWQAEIVWADFNWKEAGIEKTKFSGKGKADHFEIAVPNGVEGNMVVGVRIKTGSELTPILWSWHLWITDYRPDEAVHLSPEPDRYVYEVPGGNVHRYGINENWTTGIYKESFMQDRSIGARSSGYDESRVGVLYYQFGRKDPFPANNVTLYGDDGSSLAIKTVMFGDLVTAQEKAGSKLYSNMQYAVHNPLTFILTTGIIPEPLSYAWMYSWTFNDIYNPVKFNANIPWHDPNIDTGNTDLKNSKSFFDPSPAGWCLPRYGVWDSFLSNQAGDWANGWNIYVSNATGNGAPTIYYPALGISGFGSLGPHHFGVQGYYWCVSPRSTSNSYVLYMKNSGVSIASDSHRATGMPVRCLKY